MTDVWEWVGSENPLHRDPEAIPLHPTLPIARHDSLAAHTRAMARVAEALVPTYAEDWGIALDLDLFRTASYIHDVAKVIEFVERDGELTGRFGTGTLGSTDSAPRGPRPVAFGQRTLLSVPMDIADYDPAWPCLFEEEKARIVAAIGPYVLAVEHIGSTGVPGLAAKPIIDIMVGIRSLADARRCIGPLEALGYEYVAEYEVELPERRYFRKVRPRPRTHHIHMVETTSDFWRTHLLFRDHLRSHPEDARAYEELKRRLATEFDTGRDYTAAKSGFVKATLDKAEKAATT